MSNPGALSVLKSNPIFKGLPGPLLAEMAELSVNRRYGSGECVFRQGEPGSALLGVIAGRIRISVSSVEGQELHLNLIEPGEIVGEIAFLDGGERTATGTAAIETTCFSIGRDAFFALLDRHPAVYRHLLTLLCARVRWTSRLVADSAFLSVPARLISRLTDLSTSGENLDDGRVRISISQAELASYLGVSRQVVNGYLRRWQDAGHLDIARGSITLGDLNSIIATEDQA